MLPAGCIAVSVWQLPNALPYRTGFQQQTDFRKGRKMIEDYYTSRTAQLLTNFDRAGRWFRSYLTERYGQAFAETVLHTARQEYEQLIP